MLTHSVYVIIFILDIFPLREWRIEMNPQQAAERLAHLDLETGVVAEVGEFGSWLTIEVNDWVHLLEKSIPRTPKVGQIATLYRLQGGDIQGIDLDGEPLFFWSKADIEAERQQELECIEAEKVEREIRKIKFFAEFDNPQSDFNRRLHRLPKVFQQRFKKFFRLGVDFWDLAWDELVACESCAQDRLYLQELARYPSFLQHDRG
jgi:hypothetical protein